MDLSNSLHPDNRAKPLIRWRSRALAKKKNHRPFHFPPSGLSGSMRIILITTDIQCIIDLISTTQAPLSMQDLPSST